MITGSSTFAPGGRDGGGHGVANFVLTPDQRSMQDSVRRLLERECPIALVQHLTGPEGEGHSDRLWSRLAEDGWVGMSFPPEAGGSGASLFDLGLVYEQAGRALVPTTLYSTIYAALMVQGLGSPDQKAALLGAIASGELIGTVAISELQAIHEHRHFTTHAERTRRGWNLSGQKAFVQNADIADFMIVVARVGDTHTDGIAAFVVPPDTRGVSWEKHSTFGGDRQSVVTFDDVTLREDGLLGGSPWDGDAWASIEAIADRATALQCMEMVGGAQHVLEMTLSHVSGRTQFGRTLASFQAVQHHLANMAIMIEGSRTSAMDALSILDRGTSAKRQVSIAKSWGSSAYVSVTLTAHQLHGGMGYTLDSPLHLWSRRAKTTQVSFGGPDDHLDRLASLMGL